MKEVILDRHYAKVPHVTKGGRHNWKCLLQGCPFLGTFSQKNYIEKHWRKDHVDCHLQITQKLPLGSKTTGVSRKADKKELIDSCDKHFGNFCQRWIKHKQDKLDFFRGEGEISKSALDESEMYGSVEPIQPFFMSVHISQEVEKWGAKVEVKRMDAKKRNLLLEWGAKYTADELNTTDASYKIRVSTLENKGSVKWAVAANSPF
ncbi:hypothetical protein AXG93_3545s1250 [Marchantia polymorpha subsp. ruderalis]|uniref:Uncharacterized protein n=1 Tax=Marchantia polymorpha subsp. ruderalis TaxID=1480154 RepID=A0A176VVY0_MARPO|nr:hypothetical protein AXG93_3545s1250 [Marchantia polymorpha subsp. ruderalis]